MSGAALINCSVSAALLKKMASFCIALSNNDFVTLDRCAYSANFENRNIFTMRCYNFCAEFFSKMNMFFKPFLSDVSDNILF